MLEDDYPETCILLYDWGRWNDDEVAFLGFKKESSHLRTPGGGDYVGIDMPQHIKEVNDILGELKKESLLLFQLIRHYFERDKNYRQIGRAFGFTRQTASKRVRDAVCWVDRRM